MTMPLGIRRSMEKSVARRAVKDLIAAGYSLTLDNGDEDEPIKDSRDAQAVLKEMFGVDDERLYARKGKKNYWVFFVYGNDGYDVISDYTVGLDRKADNGDGSLEGALDLADRLEAWAYGRGPRAARR